MQAPPQHQFLPQSVLTQSTILHLSKARKDVDQFSSCLKVTFYILFGTTLLTIAGLLFVQLPEALQTYKKNQKYCDDPFDTSKYCQYRDIGQHVIIMSAVLEILSNSVRLILQLVGIRAARMKKNAEVRLLWRFFWLQVFIVGLLVTVQMSIYYSYSLLIREKEAQGEIEDVLASTVSGFVLFNALIGYFIFEFKTTTNFYESEVQRYQDPAYPIAPQLQV